MFELAEDLDRERVEDALARRLQHDRWGHAGLPCLLPARQAETPPVTGFQPREVKFGPRGHEVVAACLRELEELVGEDGTHLVSAGVPPEVAAVAVTQVARHRVGTARFEGVAEDVPLLIGVGCLAHGRGLDPRGQESGVRPPALFLPAAHIRDMGLFEKAGRKFETFRQTAKEAAAETAEFACVDCGERFHAEREACPECGGDVVERESDEE